MSRRPPEPLTGLQGEGGSGRRQGRPDNRPVGGAFRRSPGNRSLRAAIGEGRALLQSLVSVKGAPLLDALLNRIYLARAEHALGNAAAARRLIAQAQAIARAGARPPALAAWLRLIQRAEREMRSRRPRAAQHR
jgi:hypothetical protein